MFEDYYALGARPFQLTPDPAFYFLSKSHRKAQAHLGYGLSQGEGVIVITGDTGCGKTAILAQLLAQNDPQSRTVAQVVSSALDAAGIVQAVAQAFGLGHYEHDKAAALGAIRLFLEEEAVAGRRCLLLVDDAQNLAMDALEELRMLTNHQLLNHALLQVVLVGNAEFEQKLMTHEQLEPLRQRIVAGVQITALDGEEVQSYTLHRVAVAGYQGVPAIGSDVHRQAYSASHGNPRKLNQIMNRVLLLAAVEERQECSAADVVAVAAELPERSPLPAVSGKRMNAQPRDERPQAVGENLATNARIAAQLDALVLQQNDHTATLVGHNEELSAMAKSIAELQNRLLEQEAAFRQMLTKAIRGVDAAHARELVFQYSPTPWQR